MVAVAAFLIILVILFGLENIRMFIFGTFGVVWTVVLVILILGGLIALEDWIKKTNEIEKKRAAEEKKKQLESEAEFIAKYPEEYKKSVAKDRAFFIFIGSAVAIVAILLIVLVLNR
jgi:dolichyl-phosphate-mannose--protein O-mannosyl transferase